MKHHVRPRRTAAARRPRTVSGQTIIELSSRESVPTHRHHIWPHGTLVLDLGDDVQAAAQVRDFAAHDYALRGVPLHGAGLPNVVAYYDGQHQSRLTSDQLDLVRAWVRRQGAAPSALAQAELVARRAGTARTRWLAFAVVPAVLALVCVAYAVGGGTSVRGAGPVLVSAGSVLALVSALTTWRGIHGADARANRVVPRSDQSD